MRSPFISGVIPSVAVLQAERGISPRAKHSQGRSLVLLVKARDLGMTPSDVAKSRHAESCTLSARPRWVYALCARHDGSPQGPCPSRSLSWGLRPLAITVHQSPGTLFGWQ